jgi:nucleotide-binding universal stress UspA family protein
MRFAFSESEIKRRSLIRYKRRNRGMNKILIAVDGTKNSREVVSAFYNLPSLPGEVVIMTVEDPGSGSLMYEMLGEAEMSTFKEAIKDSEYKEAKDRKAGEILSFYSDQLKAGGRTTVRSMVREGSPSDEILKAAKDENAEMIILGYSGRKGFDRLIAGSVTAKVLRGSKVPVLVAKKVLMCEEPYTWKDAYEAVFFCSAIIAVMAIFGFVFQAQWF